MILILMFSLLFLTLKQEPKRFGEGWGGGGSHLGEKTSWVH